MPRQHPRPVGQKRAQQREQRGTDVVTRVIPDRGEPRAGARDGRGKAGEHQISRRLVPAHGAPMIARRRVLCGYSSSPRRTVTALPPSFTRSPATRTRTTAARGGLVADALALAQARLPEQAERAVRRVRYRIFRRRPSSGAKKRETKPYAAEAARLVTITPRTLWQAASGRPFCTMAAKRPIAASTASRGPTCGAASAASAANRHAIERPIPIHVVIVVLL